MEKTERIFLWLFATALVLLVVWELKTRRQGVTPIGVTDSGDAGTAQSVAPTMPVGPAYLVMNQPNYNPGPPMFNVMPKMAKAVALQNSGSCWACN